MSISKSKKTKVILFEEGKIPRVFINPSDIDIEKLRNIGRVLVNPRIPKGVPIEKWELLDKRIQIGSQKSELSSTLQLVKEIEVINQPSYSDFHDLEDQIEFIKLEVIDKLNRTCIMGALMALFLLLVSFREEIQQIIRNVNV